MSTPIQFLELAGLPAAGKSTIAAQLRSELTALGYRCAVITEKAAGCPLTNLKRDWRFNAWTLCESIASLLEREQAAADEVVIIDRGLVDALGWVQWFRQTGAIGPSEAAAIESFIRIPAWFDQVAATVILRTSYETALFRRGGGGRILNEKTFAQLREAYDAVLARPELAGRCQVIDTDALTPTAVVGRILPLIRPVHLAQGLAR